MEFQGAARCGCDVTSLYPQTSRQNRRKALQQILQSLLQMMFAARAAKTAGVNRKSYVIQTPLTVNLRSVKPSMTENAVTGAPCSTAL